jgi:diguanylate cyclase (GGDEF)-like protein
MLSRIDAFLKNRSSFQVAAVSLVLTAAIAALDHTTGYELSFSIFYLVPIAFAAWYGNLRLGVFLSAVSAMTWLIVDRTAGHSYSQAIIAFWNAVVRFGFFTVTAALIAKVRLQLEKEKLMARLDRLTETMNVRAFQEEVHKLLDIAARYERPTVMGYIDLDSFKSVNDTFGHAEGDNVLRTVASIMSRSVRGTDIVGRMGGDEFAVFLPETTSSGAAVVFENLREKLLTEVKERVWPIGFSIGVAVFRTAPSSVNEAVRLADTLMYRVKKSGKNSILFEEFDFREETGQQRDERQDRKPEEE